MDIIILTSQRDLVEYNSVISPIKDKLFLCFDSITKEKMLSEGQDCYVYDEFIDFNKGREAQESILHLLNNWYISKGEDLSYFKGLSLGKAIEQEFSENLISQFRYLLSFSTAIERFLPNKIIALLPENNDTERIIKYLAVYYSIDFEKFTGGMQQICRTTPISVFFNRNSFLKNQLKKVFRKFFIFLCKLRSVFFKNKGIKRLFLLNESYVESLSIYWRNNKEVRKQFNLSFMVDDIPLRSGLKMLNWGLSLHDIKVKPLNAKRRMDLSGILKRLTFFLGSTEWKSIFIHKNPDFRDLFTIIIKEVISTKFEKIACKYLAILHFFTKNKQDFIIIPNQASIDAYLVTFAAKVLGIKTIFLFHGLLPTYSKVESFPGEEPLTDFVISWGQGDRDCYVKSGVDPHRVYVVGNPSFDRYLKLRKGPSVLSKKNNGKSSVLVLQYVKYAGIVNSKESFEYDYFLNIVKMLDRMGVGRIMFKLHPGRPNIKYYEELKKLVDIKCRLEIVQRVPIERLILESDYVIGPFSTVSLESFFLGRNYYCIHLEDFQLASPFDDRLGFAVYRQEDLEKAILEKREQPRSEILEYFCGCKNLESLPEDYYSDRFFKFFSQFKGAPLENRR